MITKNASLGQLVRFADSEFKSSGRQYTFRLSPTANEKINRIIDDEGVTASALMRVLVREGAKSFLGIDLEEEKQQAPAE